MNKEFNRTNLASIGGIFLLVFILVSPGVAQRQRRVDGGPPHCWFGSNWLLVQANGFNVWMELTQRGQDITGKASYHAGRKGTMQGSVKGRVWLRVGQKGPQSDANHIRVEIQWHGMVGVYEGYRISTPDADIEGETWEKNNPGRRSTWRGDQQRNKIHCNVPN